MVLGGYGLNGYPTDALRGEVNRFQGNSDPNEGTSLPALSAVAQRAGLYPVGLYSGPGIFKRWTLDDVRTSLKAGRPIITLTRYADLPGNSYFDGDTNHYIVLSGLSGDNFIYNDSAYFRGIGRGLMISPEVLTRAWANSVIPGHAVAFALDAEGGGVLGRNIRPVTDDEPSIDAAAPPDTDTADPDPFQTQISVAQAGAEAGHTMRRTAPVMVAAASVAIAETMDPVPSSQLPVASIPAALGASAVLLAGSAAVIAFTRRRGARTAL